MEDLIVNIAEGNIIEYKNIFFYVVLYLCSLWLLFAIWVYFDAKKRFEGNLLPALLAFVVFVLNFPALMFYLIIRPEDEDDFMFVDPAGHHHARGGVDVPLVNFVGKQGEVELSLYMKVSKSKPTHDEDMKINIDFTPNSDYKISERRVETPASLPTKQEPKTPSNVEAKFSSFLNKTKGKFGSALEKVKNYSSSIEDDSEGTDSKEKSEEK